MGLRSNDYGTKMPIVLALLSKYNQVMCSLQATSFVVLSLSYTFLLDSKWTMWSCLRKTILSCYWRIWNIQISYCVYRNTILIRSCKMIMTALQRMVIWVRDQTPYFNRMLHSVALDASTYWQENPVIKVHLLFLIVFAIIKGILYLNWLISFLLGCA